MMVNDIDSENIMTWVGRQQVTFDHVAEAPIKGMQATLNHKSTTDLAGFILPSPWHWLYFLPTAPTTELGEDGHEKRGGFLPPVSLPRRMWAGGDIELVSPLNFGDHIKKISTIFDIKQKHGKSGELVFVTVNHEIYAGERLAIKERQDIVYLDVSDNKPRPVVPSEEVHLSRIVDPTEAMLFRYSALTFNAHRIHYDRAYAEKEGYSDLVVHGPLIVTLLLDFLREIFPDAKLENFNFRGIKPLLVTAPFVLEACLMEEELNQKKILLWAKDSDGAVTMRLEAYIKIRS